MPTGRRLAAEQKYLEQFGDEETQAEKKYEDRREFERARWMARRLHSLGLDSPAAIQATLMSGVREGTWAGLSKNPNADKAAVKSMGEDVKRGQALISLHERPREYVRMFGSVIAKGHSVPALISFAALLHDLKEPPRRVPKNEQSRIGNLARFAWNVTGNFGHGLHYRTISDAMEEEALKHIAPAEYNRLRRLLNSRKAQSAVKENYENLKASIWKALGGMTVEIADSHQGALTRFKANGPDAIVVLDTKTLASIYWKAYRLARARGADPEKPLDYSVVGDVVRAMVITRDAETARRVVEAIRGRIPDGQHISAEEREEKTGIRQDSFYFGSEKPILGEPEPRVSVQVMAADDYDSYMTGPHSHYAHYRFARRGPAWARPDKATVELIKEMANDYIKGGDPYDVLTRRAGRSESGVDVTVNHRFHSLVPGQTVADAFLIHADEQGTLEKAGNNSYSLKVNGEDATPGHKLESGDRMTYEPNGRHRPIDWEGHATTGHTKRLMGLMMQNQARITINGRQYIVPRGSSIFSAIITLHPQLEEHNKGLRIELDNPLFVSRVATSKTGAETARLLGPDAVYTTTVSDAGTTKIRLTNEHPGGMALPLLINRVDLGDLIHPEARRRFRELR